MLPIPLQSHLQQLLNASRLHAKPLSGGDIHRAALIATHNGATFFLKFNSGEQAPEMFRTEALGLALLGASKVIAVPKVLGHGAVEGFAFILLEYIAPGQRNRHFWEHFGESLAVLHSTTSAQFGFAHDNFIGSLPQSNTRHDTWPAFYTEQRLLPQMKLACQLERLNTGDERRLEQLCKRLESICPHEPPALVHGDLWSGNFLCNAESKPVLIDPAASFSHRELDLAMSRLFGGFDPVFYQSYAAAWPIEAGFEERIGIYQLYYLLVHVNLFGGGYVEEVRQVLQRY